jgi:hypothetical protein
MNSGRAIIENGVIAFDRDEGGEPRCAESDRFPLFVMQQRLT